MADSSMASAYKILKVLKKADGGLSYSKLKMKLPFLDVSALLEKLEALGYVTHRITAHKVKEKRRTRISHEEDNLWYISHLGETALEQHLESNPPVDMRLVIALVAVAAVCGIILFLIFKQPTN